MKWQEALRRIFKDKELRNKILFIFLAFAVFRTMANIPIPGIDVANLKKFFQQFQMLGLLNVFTGGALERFSIVMLGLGPYITAVVILQLLTMVFPQLEKMYKEEGEQGRAKFEQYGRILTVPLAMLQAFGMLVLFSRQGILTKHLSPLLEIAAIFTITGGTVFLMWLGELISEKKMGDGVSLLIFAGIIADLPRNLGQVIFSFKVSLLPDYIIFLIMSLIIITGVTFVNEARRNIPVSYTKRVRGRLLYGGTSTYLPLSVNPAGVMPIIFALSILTFPPMIANFILGAGGIWGKLAVLTKDIFNNSIFYSTVYFLLIVLFTFFYTMVTFDPKSISENLQKMGGFIPGIRPGKSTTKYLEFVLHRILLFGSFFLGFIALTPSFIQGITKITSFRFLTGGTSLLIIVAVVLDTVRAIKAQLEMREYENF